MGAGLCHVFEGCPGLHEDGQLTKNDRCNFWFQGLLACWLAGLLANESFPQSCHLMLQLPLASSVTLPCMRPTGVCVGSSMGISSCRLVARTLAQQFGAPFDEATRPYQFALSIRAGTKKALLHPEQASCEFDASLAVMSVDMLGLRFAAAAC